MFDIRHIQRIMDSYSNRIGRKLEIERIRKMIKVYQNTAVKDLRNEINELGWSGAMEKYEEVKAHLDCSSDGSENWNPEWFKHYNHVADIAVDDLDAAFHAMNVWTDDVTTLVKCHSMSVGDILEHDGKFFMVDRYGFKRVEAKA